MKTSIHSSLLTVTLSAFAITSAHAGDFLSLSPLMKADVNTASFLANPNEIVVPRLTYVDTDGDLDTVERMRVFYDVYEAGSDNKIGTSPAAVVDVPPLPCTTYNDADQDFDLKFLGDPVKNRVHTLISWFSECYDTTHGEYKETFKTLLYSANIGPTVGGMWYREWDLQAIGMNGVDFDNDGAVELALALQIPAADGTFMRMLFLDTGTGLADKSTMSGASEALDANNKYRLEYYYSTTP